MLSQVLNTVRTACFPCRRRSRRIVPPSSEYLTALSRRIEVRRLRALASPFTFSPGSIAAAKSLISTDAGIAAQKAQAKQDIGDQLKHGWNAGIRSDAALLYYTYAENHYGPGGVKTFLSAVRSVLGLSSSDKITSLDQFHGAVVQTKYCSENTNPNCNCARSRSYRFIKNTLGWDTAGNGGAFLLSA